MITRFFKKIYKFIDKYIVVPISRAIYYLSKKFKKNQGKLDKILNRPKFLDIPIFNYSGWLVFTNRF